MTKIKINATALHAVALAVEKSDTKPHLEGVHIEFMDGYMWLVATDGYRMHIFKTPFETDQHGAFTFIPLLVMKNCPKKGDIELENGAIHAGSTQISWEPMEFSRFPEWRRVVPLESSRAALDIVGLDADHVSDAKKAFRLLNKPLPSVVLYGNSAVFSSLNFMVITMLRRNPTPIFVSEFMGVPK